MTLKRAAEYLSIPENTLRWYRTIGTGPASYRLGGRVFYDRAVLDEWTNAEKLADRARRGIIVN